MVARIELPAPGDPVASVVVLAFRRADVLERCLWSLAQHRSRHPFEVTVVANGVAPEVRDVLRDRVVGARVVSSRVNRGFAGGCNLGVASTSAPFVVLLNDDAVVEPGWLDALVDRAASSAGVGVVGPLVLFPSGTVQDAGGAIGDDRMPAVVGRFADRSAPVASSPRRVEYASCCATLVRRTAWEAVNGMDERFYPAYFEDVDLCLRLARLGWEIWFEPAAVVRHEESASTDATLKSLAWEWNKERYLAAWDADGTYANDLALVTSTADLLETEIAFLERAERVLEARVARANAQLHEAWYEATRLRSDLVGLHEAFDRERAHGAWLQDRLEAERRRLAETEGALDALRNRTPYRQLWRLRERLERWPAARASLRALRRVLPP